jgi:hypothetical protein
LREHNMRKPEYKALLFDTTLRNPLRCKHFLEVLNDFDGKILTNEIINKIIFELVARKIYKPSESMVIQ